MKSKATELLKANGYKKTYGYIEKHLALDLAARISRKGKPATVKRETRAGVTIYWVWEKEF